jgi:hypothetical protein
MPNLPISGLPAASALDGTELLPFVQGGATTQATAQDILDANLPVTSSGITLTGDIVPSTPQGATLGSADKPFSELYLQSGSISIESDTPGDPSALISNNNGNLDISVGGMRLVQSGNSFIAETGSFQYISGSLTQEGDYTRFGDTVAIGDFTTTGSLKISGSVDIVGPLTASSAQIPNIVQNPNSIASGLYSTALGGNGQALGDGSTTVGFSSVAIGNDSFAQGNGTIASSSYQAALGLWNTQGNTKDLVVIGNGNPAPGGRSDLAHFTTSSFEVEGFISASTYYGDGSNLTGIEHPTGSLVSKAYGSFFDTTTQSGSADTAYAVKHNTTDFGSGVSIVSNTRITMAEAGIYTIISTQQFVHTQGSTVTITGWLRKNGTDVSNSGTDLRLKGNNAKDLYAINYFVSASAGDYYELIWSASDSDTEIQYTAARTSPTRPAVPSVITTVNRVG